MKVDIDEVITLLKYLRDSAILYRDYLSNNEGIPKEESAFARGQVEMTTRILGRLLTMEKSKNEIK